MLYDLWDLAFALSQPWTTDWIVLILWYLV